MPHFEAEFKDGTTYVEREDDTSEDTENKNSFYDVLKRIQDVRQFNIVVEDEDSVTDYTVDLTDGHFEINGVPFTVHDQFYTPEDIELVYWKEVRQEFDQYRNIIRRYVNRYFIGWKTINNGGKKGIQHTIAIGGK